MVKQAKAEAAAPTVYLVPTPRVEHAHGDIYEEVTEPNISPSLYQMVTTATAGGYLGNSNAYQFPDLGDDDAAHDHPDYEKLDKLDPVEKEIYVEQWLNKPENYEKKVDKEEPKAPEQKAEPETETVEGGAGHV